MGALDIGYGWGKGVAGLKIFAPDQTGFETDHAVIIIADFDDLQIMPVFASRPTLPTVLAEDFQQGIVMTTPPV
jgi:hypothetical protein